jgi:hypothetical protein
MTPKKLALRRNPRVAPACRHDRARASRKKPPGEPGGFLGAALSVSKNACGHRLLLVSNAY